MTAKSGLLGRFRLTAAVVLAGAAASVCAGFGPSAAVAHSAPAVSQGGLAIAGLSAGDMAVIARHRGQILSLAQQDQPMDAQLQRLVNHAALQRTWCLWGVMPGSLTDAHSPFNDCTQAYLAATHAALVRLGAVHPEDGAVLRLVALVSQEMAAANSATDTIAPDRARFSTANLVRPQWSHLGRHLPSLLAVLTMIALMFGGALLLRRPTA